MENVTGEDHARHLHTGGRGGAGGIRWEYLSSLCLASWFLIPGLVGGVQAVVYLANAPPGEIFFRSFSLGMAIVLIVIGALILWKMYFPALIFLVIEGSLALMGPAGGEPAGDGIVAAYKTIGTVAIVLGGSLWILERRFLSARRPQWDRPATVILLAAFALSVPLMGMRMGYSVGVALAPASVARVAEAGERLPIVSFVGEDGVAETLDEPGTVYVVNFWATWCAPCLLELPELLEMINDLPAESPVRFLAVNTEGMNRQSVEAFLEERDLVDLPVYTDPGGFKEHLGTETIPVTVLIRDRELVARHVGYNESLVGALKGEIEAALDPPSDQTDRPSPERPVL